MRLFLVIIVFCLSFGGQAQDSLTIFIPAGKSISDVAKPEKLYRYPDFRNGKVFFRDGTITSAKLNYNYLNGEVEFISGKDTLAIVKEQVLNLRDIEIDTAKFYYSGGYLEQVANIDNRKILKKQEYKVSKREKIGGYEQPSSTTAIESYSSITDSHGMMNTKLIVRENITLVRPPQYFIGDQYNTFLPANKKNFLRLYQKNKAQIERYFRSNDVDFKKLEDLKKLLASIETPKV